MAGHRRLLAIGLGTVALAAAACGGSDAPTSGDGSYSPPQQTGYDQSGYDAAAAELETQRQAVESLNYGSQLSYDAAMNAANNMTP